MKEFIDKDSVHVLLSEEITKACNEPDNILVRVAVEGFDLDKTLKLLKYDTSNIKNESTIKLIEEYSALTHIKSKELNPTNYLFRLNNNKRSKNKPIATSTVSNIISKELSNIGLEATYSDIRISCLILDFLNGASIVDINKKYNLKLQNSCQLQAVYGIHMDNMNKRLRAS